MRLAIAAWATSLATTKVPVNAKRVLTGYLLNSDLISSIGLFKSIGTTLPESSSSSVSGRKRAGSSSSCSKKMPSDVILPKACLSAEHETATPTGFDAAWRGSRITLTS